MITIESYSPTSGQDAIARAITGVPVTLKDGQERLDIHVLGVWEDDEGYYARIGIELTTLSDDNVNQARAETDDQHDLNAALAREADELLALFKPDVVPEED